MARVVNTLIQQHGDVASKPSQIFGQGEIILRIGYDKLSFLKTPIELTSSLKLETEVQVSEEPIMTT